MRHKKVTIKLDRKKGQRTSLLRNLAISLVTHEKITTTKAKALAVRRLVEPLITKGKSNSVSTLRLIESRLANKTAAARIVRVLGPRFAKRPGGYTRITKIGARRGDGAEKVVLELLSE